MKRLKLDHETAEQIRKGTISSTWRLYDDKDLSVNDSLELVDKVDPKRPETWKVFGFAHVDSVVQKRLADITIDDYDAGRNPYDNLEALLADFRHFYGPQVDTNTPVKIVRFTFADENPASSKGVVDRSSIITDLIMYADGGSRGNPGPSASGFAVFDMNGSMLLKKGVYLGLTTNNQAEYQALKLGLEAALDMGAEQVHVYMDSLLVINQMLGIFKVKNRDLWPIHTAIKELLPKFTHVTFTHVPRELNKIADAAVNEALDEAAKHNG